MLSPIWEHSPLIVTGTPRAPAPSAGRRWPVSRGLPGPRADRAHGGARRGLRLSAGTRDPGPLVEGDTRVITPSASRRGSPAAARPPPGCPPREHGAGG